MFVTSIGEKGLYSSDIFNTDDHLTSIVGESFLVSYVSSDLT